MTCPRCHCELKGLHDVCPDCGIRLMRSVSGVIKTSAVMIACGRERGFYHSVQEVPEPLRTQLLETTTSMNSGTIVIADRAGKERLTQAMARRASAQTRKPEPRADTEEEVREDPRSHRIAWAGLALVLLLAAAASAFFYLHW